MSSPLKRRVLAPLDANAVLPSPMASGKSKPVSLAPSQPSQPPQQTPQSPQSPQSPIHSPRTNKRPLPQADEKDQPASQTASQTATPPSSKKMCLGEPVLSAALTTTPASAPVSAPISAPAACRRRDSSLSPTPPSSVVFDNSGLDTTLATNLTDEPELEGAVPASRQPRILTREQSRRRAEILKLRLGLARYKVRTGQVNVPLEQLRVVPTGTTTTNNNNNSHIRSQSLGRSWSPVPLAQPASSEPSPQLPRIFQSCLLGGRLPGRLGRLPHRSLRRWPSAYDGDSSSDDDEFVDHPDIGGGGRRVVSRAVPAVMPAASQCGQVMGPQDLDALDRIEDSDRDREAGDEEGKREAEQQREPQRGQKRDASQPREPSQTASGSVGSSAGR